MQGLSGLSEFIWQGSVWGKGHGSCHVTLGTASPKQGCEEALATVHGAQETE